MARRKVAVTEGMLCVREVRTEYVAAVDDADRSAIDETETAARVARTLFGMDVDPQENLIGIYLDSRNRIVASERLFRGTVNECTVGVREIVRTALMLNAVGIIVVHNHPSGDPAPSANDIAMTRNLSEACRVMCLSLIDHVIVAGSRHCSLKSRGLIG